MLELDFSAAFENIDVAPQPSAWIGHIPFGAWLMNALRPSVFVELGTHYGHSYFSFCQAAERALLKTKCYAIDTWQGDEHAGLYGEEIFASVQARNIPFQDFSRLLRMRFDDAIDYFLNGSVDLLHIDGLHTYEAVKHDFETWTPKLSRRAVVLFHDINVRERDFGVWRLWEELKSVYPAIEFMHSHGLGVLFYGQEQSSTMLTLRQTWGTDSGRTYVSRLFANLGRLLELDRRNAELSSVIEQQSAKTSNTEAQLRGELSARDHRIEELVNLNAQSVRRAEIEATARAKLESERQRAQMQFVSLEEEAKRAHAQLSSLEGEKKRALTQLTRAQHQVAELDASLHAVWASTSWKVSRPVRWMGARFANLRAVKKLVKPASNAAGGPLRLALTAGRVIAREGISGFKRRIVAFDQQRGRAAYGRATTAAALRNKRAVVNRHSAEVDVIVCVHNALSDVKNCLSSIVANTLPPYRLIVVDDGSGEETKNYLANFIDGQGGLLIRHETAKGYTLAANAGMRASSGGFVVLLNSDTVVSAQWLDRMIECALSDPRIGMVGPLSNTASWQSIPQVFDEDGDWSSNPLDAEMTITAMAQRVAMASRRSYPRVGFLNGFCMLIRREQLTDLGLFDEETFGKGYGEENDLCVRAYQKGWQLAIADDVYVFHAQSKSYSTERRIKLAKAADENLHRKHDGAQILSQLDITRNSFGLAAARSRVQVIHERLQIRDQIRNQYEGRRILIILPVSHAGGGANVILSEALALQECGVDVVIANIDSARTSFEGSYPDCKLPMLWLADWNGLAEHIHLYEAVVATLYLSVYWLQEALANATLKPSVTYYIQDFEPDFFAIGSQSYLHALESYTAIPMSLVTKTDWNRRMVEKNTGKSPIVIGPSFDWSRFPPPSIQRGAGRVVVCAMVRPSTPRRAPEMTVDILAHLIRERKSTIQVLTFGCSPDDPILQPLQSSACFEACGELSPTEVETLMQRIDVFVDLSTYQAMGVTCMEAMACGVAVVGPINGGLSEIVQHEESGLLIDTGNQESSLNACLRLIDDFQLRQRLGAAGIEAIAAYFPDKPALKLMRAMFPDN